MNRKIKTRCGTHLINCAGLHANGASLQRFPYILSHDNHTRRAQRQEKESVCYETWAHFKQAPRDTSESQNVLIQE